MAKKIWTKDKVLNEALKFKTRAEFQLKSNSAYRAALRDGYLNDACGHMEIKRKIWSEEDLLEEAKKYDSITEFRSGSRTAYELSLKRGTIFEIRKFLKRENRYKWEYDDLKEVSSKYDNIKDFRKDYIGAYIAIRRTGLVDELCGHMKETNIKWSDDMILEEAKKYKTKIEFMKNSSSAYYASLKRGLHERSCAHMEPSGGAYKRCLYLCTFEDGAVYVGLTFCVRERELRRRLDANDPVTIYKKNTGLEYTVRQITDFLEAKEASKREEIVRMRLISQGKNVLNRAKGGSLGTVYGEQKVSKVEKKFDEEEIIKTPFNKKPIIVIDIKDMSERLFESGVEAAEFLNVSKSLIVTAIKKDHIVKKRYKLKYGRYKK